MTRWMTSVVNSLKFKAMRRIDKIIVHCTATPANRNVTIDDITRWHKARGFKTIGYHYVIYLDGSIHNGRPIETIGAHCSGQNANSIGVCYVGGIDLAGKPSDTRTPMQKRGLLKILKELHRQFPESTIHGHREFAAKDCPCFDAQQEYKQL